jgi:uncharacterized protein YbjT (DUF2867 family)
MESVTLQFREPSPNLHNRKIFISGRTGYLGLELTRKLTDRGHSVRVLARRGSESKVAPTAQAVMGNALEGNSFAASLEPGMTFVHLTGTPHPAPWKDREFRAIDLVSLRESASAAKIAGIGHFVYVSVAHPAPMMRAYQKVRTECEAILAESNLTRTNPSTLVCFGAGASLAGGAAAYLFSAGSCTFHPRRSLTARACHTDQMTSALL